MKIKLAIEFETEIESYKELDDLIKHINNAVHNTMMRRVLQAYMKWTVIYPIIYIL